MTNGKQQRRDWKNHNRRSLKKLQEKSDKAKISKKQVIRLLKKHGVKDTENLEAPDVETEDVIPTLKKN